VTLALDHIVVGASSLEVGRVWAVDHLGVEPVVGGRHVFMGTHNLVLRLEDPAGTERYLEILAIDADAPHPGRPRWFDLDDPAIRSALATGPRLIAWVARSDDLEHDRERLVAAGHDPGRIHSAERDTPSGRLRWRITIRDDGRRLANGAVPVLIAWDSPSPAASLPQSGVTIERLAVRGVPARVAAVIAEAGVDPEEGTRPGAMVTLAGRQGRWSGSTVGARLPAS
jgi:hypothetical protein